MKKTLCLLVAMVMIFGVAAFSPSMPSVQAEKSITTGGPFDLAIANDEKLIEMLKARGDIAADATQAEAEKALTSFLRAKAKNAKNVEQNTKIAGFNNQSTGKVYNQSILKGKGNKLGQSKKKLPTAEAEVWNGEVTTDKVLVLLIDFPDYPHNSITSDETDMYYQDYTKAHYQDMIFGENGYVGPSGENLISMRQYYEQQSGGSYTVEGTVAGWYTASNPAAYYGGNYPTVDDSDAEARSLVYEALLAVGQDPSVDLSEFDNEDRYDLDGDGNLREPDGLVDHLMVMHASVGEEAGGGALGSDAIWSHRWNLGGIATIPGTTAEVGYWGGLMGAYDYTIQPEDGAAGVCAHEYGHDLGLPDEYDTQYTGNGEPVSYWSIMSSGSWVGEIGGTEPSGFSPYAKEYFQATLGGNWLTGTTIELDEITSSGVEILLDQASTKGTNDDVVKINLPEKETIINVPISGQYEYHSGSGNDLDNAMYAQVDLSGATNANLAFKAWYQIEQDWDYASVYVSENGLDWETIAGNITTTENPFDQNPGNGITGHSDGWVDAEFDLSAYAGKNITLMFNYWTDGYVAESGMFVDDIVVTADGNVVAMDNADDSILFELAGFEKSLGKVFSNHYYLVEWRNHAGVDAGLGHIPRGNSHMSFDPGMVVWYVDEYYDNNFVGTHPGDGFLGIVDADQRVNKWSDGEVAATRYQVHDAAFGIEKTEKMYLDYNDSIGVSMKDNYTKRNPMFDDSTIYANDQAPSAGRNLVEYGIKIRVVQEGVDRSTAKILLYR